MGRGLLLVAVGCALGTACAPSAATGSSAGGRARPRASPDYPPEPFVAARIYKENADGCEDALAFSAHHEGITEPCPNPMERGEEISRGQAERIVALLDARSSYSRDAVGSGFVPEHRVVFFDDAGKPVATILIDSHLTGTKIRASPRLPEVQRADGDVLRWQVGGGGGELEALWSELELPWLRGADAEDAQEAMRRRARDAGLIRRSLEMAPSSLRGFPRAWNGTIDLGDVDAARAALAQQYADRAERIRALLRWFSTGPHPWPAEPAFDGWVRAMLWDYDVPALDQALTGTPTDDEIEGAARFLCGSFHGERAKQLERMSPAVRQRISNHMKRSSDPDKREATRRTLGP